MNDLPPSYEAVTGIPATPNPSALPPSQICASTQHSTTIPIPTQTTIQYQQQPPYPVNSYPTSLPSPQTNVILRRPSKNKRTQEICCSINMAILCFIIFAIVTVVAFNKSKPKYTSKPDVSDTFENIYGQPEYPKFDWDAFRKEQQETLERYNRRPYEIPKFDFN